MGVLGPEAPRSCSLVEGARDEVGAAKGLPAKLTPEGTESMRVSAACARVVMPAVAGRLCAADARGSGAGSMPAASLCIRGSRNSSEAGEAIQPQHNDTSRLRRLAAVLSAKLELLTD